MAIIPINLQTGEINKSDDSIIIGIDLGTTNSLVAIMQDGSPIAVKGEQKDALVPSMIYFDPDGSIKVGQEAKLMVSKAPERTLFSVKRLMGKAYNDVENVKKLVSYKIIEEDTDQLVKIQVDDRFYTPIDLSALILKELKLRIEKHLGQAVSKAVITVPAYFNDTQRQATRDAGKLAGLDVLRIVNEPTAAALAYGLNSSPEPQNIAVFDLGGGTFDISILHIEDGIFEVLSTHGDTFLGGDDFDKAIMDHWGISDLQSENHKQEIRIAAELAKKTISGGKNYSGKIADQNLEISTDTFQEISKPLIDRTIASCQQAMKDAQLTKEQIDHVILVGGSTRMPVVKEAVKIFFNKEANDTLNPDEVVAQGAAIQASILAGKNKDLLLLDITPLSLGIETVGGLMDTIIPRNTTVPTKAGRQYTTSVDGQTKLKVAVFQGERDLVEDNRKLGEFILSGIPPMPAGLPKIEIQFIIDADGILKVKAKELRSNVETQIDIQSQYGISEEDMARMLMDSMHNAETDMKERVIREAINEANNVLLSGNKFMEQHVEILSDEEKSKMTELIGALSDSIKSKDKDSINTALQTFNEYSAPLAHRAMDITIGGALKGKNLNK